MRSKVRGKDGKENGWEEDAWMEEPHGERFIVAGPPVPTEDVSSSPRELPPPAVPLCWATQAYRSYNEESEPAMACATARPKAWG